MLTRVLLLPLLLFLLSLSGCIFLAGAALGATAIVVVYDHRTIAKTVTDTKIENHIVENIQSNPDLHNNCHIEVSVFNHTVLLAGQAPDATLKKAAMQAATIPEVMKIYNEISIEGPTSPLTRTSDGWITTKIKTEMLADEDLKSSSIKVVTENGTVFLMGRVNERQAEIAIDIAKEVSGVQKVIKIFEYT